MFEILIEEDAIKELNKLQKIGRQNN